MQYNNVMCNGRDPQATPSVFFLQYEKKSITNGCENPLALQYFSCVFLRLCGFHKAPLRRRRSCIKYVPCSVNLYSEIVRGYRRSCWDVWNPRKKLTLRKNALNLGSDTITRKKEVSSHVRRHMEIETLC